MNQNEKKTNILAILGFIFSFFIAIVGLVLSILGLNKSKETGSGKGLSIAGIVISSISIVMSILIMIFAPYYLSNNSGSENEIKSFLAGNYVAYTDVLGTNIPQGLYFDKNGNFVSYSGDACFMDLISYKGTYEIVDNKLILNVEEEDYATNGTYESNSKYACLVTYEHSIKKIKRTEEYIINGFSDEGNRHLKLNNDLNLYQVSIPTELFETAIKDGYSDKYFDLVDSYYSKNFDRVSILDSDLKLDDYSFEYVSTNTFDIIQNSCGVNVGDKISFTIVDGKLNLKNNNTGEEYTVMAIGEIKTIMYLNLYTGCGEDEIIVLTKDGKLYETDLYINKNIDNINNFESKLNYIEFPYDIAEIGIIKNISPAQPKELLLKDINGVEYYRDGHKYYKISN